MAMKMGLVCDCQRRTAWVGCFSVVILLLLSNQFPSLLSSSNAQPKELQFQENIESKRGLADPLKKRIRRKRKFRRRRRRKKGESSNTDSTTELQDPKNVEHTYFDIVKSSILDEPSLHNNGIDDYEWPFAYYVEFIGYDLRLFNNIERDILSVAFNKSYSLLNISYSTILEIYMDNQTLTDIVEDKGTKEGNSNNRRLGRRRSLISRFRGISMCRRCPKKRYRDPLFQSRTKRRLLQNEVGEDSFVAGDLMPSFVESLNIAIISGDNSLVNS
jgi:hypothetical protein